MRTVLLNESNVSINDPTHLSDEEQSLFIDQALDPSQTVVAQRHISECARCATEIDDLRATVRLMRALPERRPARSFVIAPRPIEARLRWWDVTLRGFAGAAAALFVIMLSADLFTVGRAGSTPSLAPISAPAAPQREVQPALRSASESGQAAATPAATASVAPRVAYDSAPAAPRAASAPSAATPGAAPTAPVAEAPARVEALATRDTASSVGDTFPPISTRTMAAGAVAILLGTLAILRARRRSARPPNPA